MVHGKDQFAISVKKILTENKVELRSSITNFKNGIALGYFNRCVWYNTVTFFEQIPDLSEFFTKESFKQMNFVAKHLTKNQLDPFDQLVNQKLEDVVILSYYDK